MGKKLQCKNCKLYKTCEFAGWNWFIFLMLLNYFFLFLWIVSGSAFEIILHNLLFYIHKQISCVCMYWCVVLCSSIIITHYLALFGYDMTYSCRKTNQSCLPCKWRLSSWVAFESSKSLFLFQLMHCDMPWIKQDCSKMYY